VAHQDDRGARLLGVARQLRGAFAHLRHRAGGGGQRLGIHGLDRVDHGDVGLEVGELREDGFQPDFRQHRQVGFGKAQAACAQRHLAGRFLAAYIEGLHAA